MNLVAERNQVLELIQTLPDEHLDYVFRVIQSLPQKQNASSRCNLRGTFAKYANPDLRAKEKEAWALAAEEKHGLR